MSVWFCVEKDKDDKPREQKTGKKLRLELGELYLEKHFWRLSLPNRTRQGVLPNQARRGACWTRGGFLKQRREEKKRARGGCALDGIEGKEERRKAKKKKNVAC